MSQISIDLSLMTEVHELFSLSLICPTKHNVFFSKNHYPVAQGQVIFYFFSKPTHSAHDLGAVQREKKPTYLFC